MIQYDEYVYHKARDGILRIRDDIVSDIYALSFYHWEDEDDPRRPILTVGYNTNARWHGCSPGPDQVRGWPRASGADEAKWNFAFWLQNEGTACEIGDSPEDLIAGRRWIESLGLWYSDEEDEEDFDKCDELGLQITKQFVGICISVAQQLHSDGTILARFGRSIPIIVHELEYYDAIAEATRQANPPGLTDEFQDWVDSLYNR